MPKQKKLCKHTHTRCFLFAVHTIRKQTTRARTHADAVSSSAGARTPMPSSSNCAISRSAAKRSRS